MANISSVGIGSGVLTSDLIDKLVAAEREPTELRLDAKEESITAELSIFGQIQSAITDFRLASRPLADPSLFQSLQVSSSNSAITASASTQAQEGVYSLEVERLATSESLASTIFSDSDTTEIGEGTLTITSGSTSATITIGSTNNTLDGIAAAINGEDDLGVTASVLNVGTGYRLVLTSNETGEDAAITVSVSDTGDANNTDANGLSRLSYTTGAENLEQKQAAQNALFQLNGVDIERATNTVDDVLTGVTFTLNGTNVDSPAKIEVSRNTEQVIEKVEAFVEAYNAVKSLIEESTEFNADNPAASGILMGDSATRSINTQMQRIIGQSIQGLGSASVRSLSELGILTNKDTGQLEFNSSTLESKLASDPESVTAIFADQGRTSDSQIEFIRASSNTVPGSYDINITQAATKGTITGSVALGGSTIIDADNDELSITVDGVASGVITLSAGTYTAEQLATELQNQINADSTLAGAGVSVAVSIDGSGQIVLASDNFGSDSTIELNTVDTNTLAQLGLDVGAGIDGLDVAGTINGVEASGSGQTLTAASGNKSEGIRILVTGSATGDRGTVSYIEGVGEQMVDMVNSLLGANGAITAKNERLNSQLQFIAEERVALEERIITLNDRLVAQFTAADILISQLNSTQEYISAQLDALTASASGKND